MVTPGSQVIQKGIKKRIKREYSLEAVRRLASEQKVSYGSRDVIRDTENFGYSLDDVCNCLASLQEDDYHESVDYGDKRGWLDVYKCSWPAPVAPESRIDNLYVKFKLNRDCILIVLASFHPEGAL